MFMTCVETQYKKSLAVLIAQFLPSVRLDQVKHTQCLVLIGKNQLQTKVLLSKLRIKIKISLLMKTLMELFQEV